MTRQEIAASTYQAEGHIESKRLQRATYLFRARCKQNGKVNNLKAKIYGAIAASSQNYDTFHVQGSPRAARAVARSCWTNRWRSLHSVSAS